MRRRDLFIFVPRPGEGESARTYLADWLRSLDGHPGFLGGSVLQEVAGELLPDTLVMTMEFESTEAARALWPTIEDTVNPLYPDDKSDASPDQAPAFFDRDQQLRFTRGDGRLARMLHIHAGVAEEVSAG